MNQRTLVLGFVSALLGLALSASAQPAPGFSAKGKIEFAQPVFDFGKVRHDEIVKHTFVFTNTGSETLEISHVQPSCGCTAAGDWTRRVEPGQTGSIPVQLNTHGFSGQVLKTVTVMSSASQLPVILQIKGNIWKPIEITPQFAVINVSPDDDGQGAATVHLINNTGEQLRFGEPEVNNRAFSASLSKNPANSNAFIVTVQTVPPLPKGNNIQGDISISTGSTNLPVVNIRVWANVQPPLVVLPAQITLPAGPLGAAITPSVLIQNNSTNQLVITEPSINAKDVNIDIRETQPGRQFSVALTFPQGFQLPPGRQVFFTAKSSHPGMPEIKVPVGQLARALALPTVNRPPQQQLQPSQSSVTPPARAVVAQ